MYIKFGMKPSFVHALDRVQPEKFLSAEYFHLSESVHLILSSVSFLVI